MLLDLYRTIAQPAESVEADSTCKRVAGFTLVQLRCCLSPKLRQLQPIQRKQCAFDPTDFSQGERQPILPWIGTEALEHQGGTYRAGAYRCSQAQNVIPVRVDEFLIDTANDEWLQCRPCAGGAEGIEPALCEIGNSRGEAESQQVRQSKDVIADSAAVRVMGGDVQIRLMVSRPSIT
jgi:hypothetical protein